ncbi:Sodium nucleoside protein [Mycena sanguinolenta]|uniref:Protein HRI1 n=1 Tax=Mycena sanguinolenta TaxID=230812 RepID=A0A8H7DFE7_9AGAR|nr:Sodium nucleoside protein [Mycena sanguinolenta]
MSVNILRNPSIVYKPAVVLVSPMPAAFISFRESIRWLPEEPFEPTQTIVLTSAKSGVFLDVRFNKEAGASDLDWAFAGYRSSPTPTSTKFTHHIDSRTLALTQDPLQVVDVGTNTPLPGMRTLEAGEMVNPATGIMTQYEEIWRDEECDQAVFLRNVAGSVWRAWVGRWQLALGRTPRGEFWAWQGFNDGSEQEAWTRPFSTHLVGSDNSEQTYLPRDCHLWEKGSTMDWAGDRWFVLD